MFWIKNKKNNKDKEIRKKVFLPNVCINIYKIGINLAVRVAVFWRRAARTQSRLVLIQNKEYVYTLEPPQHGGFNVFPQFML